MVRSPRSAVASSPILLSLGIALSLKNASLVTSKAAIENLAPECSAADSENGICKTPTSTNASIKNDTKPKGNGDSAFIEPGQCALYLAPSTLPKANLGLFSGVHIPKDMSANEYLGGSFPGYDDSDDESLLWDDLYIPVTDHYKALPYRGQQLFPSWLAYIWPDEPGAFFDGDVHKPFPEVPREMWAFDEGFNAADNLEFYSKVADEDDDEDDDWDEFKVSAFVPGIVSLANSHPRMDNLGLSYDNVEIDYAGMTAPFDAGAGSFTPYHGVTFEAKKTVVSGMELLLNYGNDWHRNNNERMKGIKYTGTSEIAREKKGFVEGIDKKWDVLVEREIGALPWELPTEKGKRDNLSKKMAFDSSELEEGEMPYSEYRDNTYHPGEKEDEDDEEDGEDEDPSDSFPNLPEDLVKPISWLGQNGVCLSSGRLQVRKSSIPHAGRGVFATTSINAGDVVLVSPLIAMRRDDFRVYKTDTTQKLVRNTVDKTTVIGEELLLNYGFGHPDSPMLLVPTAPLTNFINHGSPRVRRTVDKEDEDEDEEDDEDEDEDEKESFLDGNLEPNVRIRWPKSNTNAAKLFSWVFHNHGNLYTKFDENNDSLEQNPWLNMHPIDVMERSGKLGIEYEALRYIRKDEEILIDYGSLWEEAWKEYRSLNPYGRSRFFRHYIQVPPDFYPSNWLHVSDTYEIAEVQDLENKPLEVGKVVPLTWAHNGKPVSSKHGYVVGLPKGFSERFREYSEKEGVVELYRHLLTEQDGYVLPSDGFDMFQPHNLVANATKEMEFFAHRYHSDQWKFNMHFVAAWNELARKFVLESLGEAGFDHALRGIGERFGYDNMTCFHASYMGMTHCDKSKMHSDIYATEDKSWNIVFPLVTVEGTEPELDIMAEDMNTVIGVHYLKDLAYVIGDFGYHQTRPSEYYVPENNGDEEESNIHSVPIRVVFGAYCAQIDETNVAMIRHIYDGDDPAPFADQFVDLPMREIHWDRSGISSLKNPSRG